VENEILHYLQKRGVNGEVM